LSTAIITGSGGLIGSQSVRHFVQLGYEVIGFENDMRASFFGNSASTRRVTRELEEAFAEFHSLSVDIRDTAAVDRVFAQHKGSVELVVHTAAQPSHDWSAKDPRTDFSVNTYGTINLLEAARQYVPDATFIFTSTNKVYGDRPNSLPLEERETRYELPDGHRYTNGIDTTMSIDRSMHSPFGASKAAADLIVQEYGRYFGMPTVAFRGGCLTGPSHAGAQLHGFLSYLMRCTVTGEPYSVFGYKAKQVRDNIHSHDVVRAFEEFHSEPRQGSVSTWAGDGIAIAPCSKRSSCLSRLLGVSLGGHSPTRPAAVIISGGSATSASSRQITRGGRPPTTYSRSCARFTTRTSSAGLPKLRS
jgi:CDP-paratose 2-epimerase